MPENTRVPVTFTVDAVHLEIARKKMTDHVLADLVQRAIDVAIQSAGSGHSAAYIAPTLIGSHVAFAWQDVCELAEVKQPTIERPKGYAPLPVRDGRRRALFEFEACASFLMRRFVRLDAATSALRTMCASLKVHRLDPVALCTDPKVRDHVATLLS